MSQLFIHIDPDGDELVVSTDVDPDDGVIALTSSEDTGKSITINLDERAAEAMVDALLAELMRHAVPRARAGN